MTQKEKALECMQKLNIYTPYIKKFDKDGTVTLFERFGGYYIDEYQEPELLKKIKEFDRKVDNKTELKHAKDDLENIFEVNTKGMTKNKIFLEHQSKMVNSIYSEILLDESYF